MALYDFTPTGFKPVPTTTFPALGTLERQHLQAALRDSISAVTPGTDTMVLAEEFGNWEGAKRRIDLLCLDSEGHLVVVELKRDDASHMELQSLRYAAMISTMRFDQAVEAHRAYCISRGKDASAAEEDIRSFLGAEADGPLAFHDTVRIVLAAFEFSTEVTTTVLWLNSMGLDIRCVQMRPYSVGQQTLVHIEQIIPLPQVAEYQVAIREKSQAQTAAAISSSSRDYSKFDLNIAGEPPLLRLNKRGLMLNLVKAAIRHGVSPDTISAQIPKLPGPPIFISATVPEGIEPTFAVCFPGKPAERWFSSDEELIVQGGSVYALTNQWGTRTVETADAIVKMVPGGVVAYEPAP